MSRVLLEMVIPLRWLLTMVFAAPTATPPIRLLADEMLMPSRLKLILFAWTRLPVAPVVVRFWMLMPSEPLSAMRFPAPRFVPPMRLLDASSIRTPSKRLGRRDEDGFEAMLNRSEPISLFWTTFPLAAAPW